MNRCSHVTMLGTPCKNSLNCHLHSSDDTCSICLCIVRKTRGTRSLPCGHLFHRRCIEQWKIKCTTCPMCRESFDVPTYKVTITIENTTTNICQTITTVNSSNICEIFEQLDVAGNPQFCFNVENFSDLETLLADFGFGVDDTIISVR